MLLLQRTERLIHSKIFLMDYTSRIEEMTDSLRRNNQIELVQADIFQKEMENEILLERNPGLRPFRQALRILNGNSLLWNVTGAGGTKQPGGEFFLCEAEAIMSGMMHLELTTSGDATENFAASHFRLMEDHPQTGDGLMTGLVFPDEQGAPELWLYDNGELLRLNLTINTYIEHLLALKGMFNWQYLFTASATGNALVKKRRTQLRKQLELFGQLFPGEDFSYYTRLLKK